MDFVIAGCWPPSLQFLYIPQLALEQLPLSKLDLFLSFVLFRAC